MEAPLLFFLLCLELALGEPKIEISDIVECEEQELPTAEGLEVEAKFVGEGSAKALNAKVSLPFDVDETIKYKADVKRFVKGKWQPLGMTFAGGVCEHVPKYLPGLWEKLSKAVGAPNECPIKAGTYSVDGFTAEATDVKLPVVLPGRYQVSALVLKDDKPILCKQTEITISRA